MTNGKVFSINTSKTKGISKTPVDSAKLIEGLGLENDAHAAGGIKQVSLLAIESIRRQSSVIARNEETKQSLKDGDCHAVVGRACPANGGIPRTGRLLALKPGDFAENITTEGINLVDLKIGTKLKVGEEAIIEISKIGKDCHKYCAIYYKTGDCIMPREGIFAKVLKSGTVKVHDKIEIFCHSRGSGNPETL